MESSYEQLQESPAMQKNIGSLHMEIHLESTQKDRFVYVSRTTNAFLQYRCGHTLKLKVLPDDAEAC